MSVCHSHMRTSICVTNADFLCSTILSENVFQFHGRLDSYKKTYGQMNINTLKTPVIQSHKYSHTYVLYCYCVPKKSLCFLL